jgi:hypothetical protein
MATTTNYLPVGTYSYLLRTAYSYLLLRTGTPTPYSVLPVLVTGTGTSTLRLIPCLHGLFTGALPLGYSRLLSAYVRTYRTTPILLR